MAPTPRIRRCYHGLGQCAIDAPVAALMGPWECNQPLGRQVQ